MDLRFQKFIVGCIADCGHAYRSPESSGLQGFQNRIEHCLFSKNKKWFENRKSRTRYGAA